MNRRHRRLLNKVADAPYIPFRFRLMLYAFALFVQGVAFGHALQAQSHGTMAGWLIVAFGTYGFLLFTVYEQIELERRRAIIGWKDEIVDAARRELGLPPSKNTAAGRRPTDIYYSEEKE